MASQGRIVERVQEGVAKERSGQKGAARMRGAQKGVESEGQLWS